MSFLPISFILTILTWHLNRNPTCSSLTPPTPLTGDRWLAHRRHRKVEAMTFMNSSLHSLSPDYLFDPPILPYYILPYYNPCKCL